jgi:hypothetical protein
MASASLDPQVPSTEHKYQALRRQQEPSAHLIARHAADSMAANEVSSERLGRLT